jgi:hypothetical protein
MTSSSKQKQLDLSLFMGKAILQGTNPLHNFEQNYKLFEYMGN